MNIPNRITLENLDRQSIGDIIALPANELAPLQAEVEEHFRKARLLREWFNGALIQKFEQRARAERLALNKDSGTVRFADGPITVVADMSKRVDWNQAKLAAMVTRIRDAKDDPAQYVDITYKVSERKYTAWPDAIREGFEPARTVRTGTLSVTLIAAEDRQ